MFCPFLSAAQRRLVSELMLMQNSLDAMKASLQLESQSMIRLIESSIDLSEQLVLQHSSCTDRLAESFLNAAIEAELNVAALVQKRDTVVDQIQLLLNNYFECCSATTIQLMHQQHNADFSLQSYLY